MNAQSPSFSRRIAFAAVFGKCDDELKFRCTSEMKADVQRRSAELGLAPSDFLRMTLSIALYGKESVLSVTQRQIEEVAGNAD